MMIMIRLVTAHLTWHWRLLLHNMHGGEKPQDHSISRSIVLMVSLVGYLIVYHDVDNFLLPYLQLVGA